MIPSARKDDRFGERTFLCPRCHAYAQQDWFWASPYDCGSGCIPTSGDIHYGTCVIYSICRACAEISIWEDTELAYPDFGAVDPPNDDLTDDIKHDYLEAASIVNKSPRGACALLRLATQKLCAQLGYTDKNLDAAIGGLVAAGLPVNIQKSLDILRVIGNNAVHPGEISLEDDRSTANLLFKIINNVAQTMITDKREVEEIYESLPESQRDHIAERDSRKKKSK